MARLRKFSAYQTIERPYTRISKYKKLSYVKARPHLTIARFDQGNLNGKFDTILYLVSEVDRQARHNALESARMTANRVLEPLGKNAYFLRLRKYPFHVLRENAMATGAGADRMSQGMARSFGKPTSMAAQIFKGETVFEVRVQRKDIKAAKLALTRANKKLPCVCRIIEKRASQPTKKSVSAPVPEQK